MKNGIKVTARLVKQLAENQQDLFGKLTGCCGEIRKLQRSRILHGRLFRTGGTRLRAELRNCSWSFDFPCFPGGGCFFRP